VKQPLAAGALPALKPVENITMREQVTLAVRTALMNGHFKPGQLVTVKSLSTMMGASVMPAREAMHRLIAEGALELRPNRSVIVPVLSAREFDELTDLRCHIEGLAASQAVELVGPAHLARLRELDALLRQAAPAADLDAYLNANFQFHFLIYRLGASDFVLSIIEKLWVRVGPLIRFSLSGRGFADSGEMHAQVIRGLETKDRAGLRQAIDADITGAAQVIRSARDPHQGAPRT
jgi:DNA-binding GntR family transcriptional regulator